MATSTPPTDPDSLAVLHALSRVDLSPEDTYNALEGLRNMSGRAVTAAIEAHNAKIDSKLDAQGAKIDSKLDAQGAKFDALESKLDTLRAMIAWGLAALGLLVAALRLFS
ncbi:MAG: hypothetical protein OXH83_01330 [Bryobacterales bacterium]|nr:hypothetical protein [Bryobacterales bacterium]